LLCEYYATACREFGELDVELGFEYADSPAVLADGSEAAPRDPIGHDYVPIARPGHRLPHAWLRLDGERVSTHHLLRPGVFLLLAGPSADGWYAAARRLNDQLEAQIDVHRLGDTLEDHEGTWGSLCGHEPDGALLVRPDGHVGFRAVAAAHDPDRELERALRVVLGQPVDLAPGGAARATGQANNSEG
jgi:2,4-dichlorophenol 6-monooxygenase